MKKSKWVDMGYKTLLGGEMDTLYKKFENGSMYIAQFNEERQEDEIGIVYLSASQLKDLTKIYSSR